jgi:hypothetical protein
MSKTLVVAILTLLVTIPAALRGQTRAADTLAAARRCLVTPLPREPNDSFLKRCAEDFVARNGYTAAPPASDSTLWASESFEFASSPAEALEHRRNTLVALAESAGCDRTGCAATFRYTNSALRCHVRVVTMTRTGNGMRMEHQDAVPVPGSKEERRCGKQGR